MYIGWWVIGAFAIILVALSIYVWKIVNYLNYKIDTLTILMVDDRITNGLRQDRLPGEVYRELIRSIIHSQPNVSEDKEALIRWIYKRNPMGFQQLEQFIFTALDDSMRIKGGKRLLDGKNIDLFIEPLSTIPKSE